MTFGEAASAYKRSDDFTDLRHSTQTIYERGLNNYVPPTFRDVKLTEIDTRAVADWLKSPARSSASAAASPVCRRDAAGRAHVAARRVALGG